MTGAFLIFGALNLLNLILLDYIAYLNKNCLFLQLVSCKGQRFLLTIYVLLF
jgi:hypothetical protein